MYERVFFYKFQNRLVFLSFDKLELFTGQQQAPPLQNPGMGHSGLSHPGLGDLSLPNLQNPMLGNMNPIHHSQQIPPQMASSHSMPHPFMPGMPGKCSKLLNLCLLGRIISKLCR